MKALVIIKKNKIKRFLVELHTDRLVEEVATLVAKKRYTEAVSVTLAKGRIEKELKENEVKGVRADLFIEEGGVI